jgi:hypothetical protein
MNSNMGTKTNRTMTRNNLLGDAICHLGADLTGHVLGGIALALALFVRVDALLLEHGSEFRLAALDAEDLCETGETGADAGRTGNPG